MLILFLFFVDKFMKIFTVFFYGVEYSQITKSNLFNGIQIIFWKCGSITLSFLQILVKFNIKTKYIQIFNI